MSANILLKLHLFAVAFWLGVVAVEFILEQSRARSKRQGFSVAAYHRQIDLFIELPAFSLVLVTGLLLLDPERLSGLYLLKVAAGMVAVIGNTWCLIPVLRRHRAAQADDLSGVISDSRLIDRISVVAIPAGILALILGFIL